MTMPLYEQLARASYLAACLARMENWPTWKTPLWEVACRAAWAYADANRLRVLWWKVTTQILVCDGRIEP